MVFKIVAILLAPFVLFATAVGFTGVLLVDVQEKGPDGMHIVVPVPLLLAEAALTFAPDEAKYVECGEFARYSRVATVLVEELRKTENFVLVEIQEHNEHILIRKEDESLWVDVLDAGEEVHVRVPLKAVQRVLRSYDGRGFSTRALIRAMRGAPRGKLVHVIDGGDEIKIRLL